MARGENAGEEVRPTVARHGRQTADDRMLTFHSRLRERGLKSTGQRDDIARVFFELRRHISAEELYAEVKKVNPHVGYATIYRTLKL
jgi:Fur family ferric uptake transcriptional regulator